MAREEAVHNLYFDKSFFDVVKDMEASTGKDLNTNGVPSHFIMLFKLFCFLPDEDLTTQILPYEDLTTQRISKEYREIFGRNINQSSISRTVRYLRDTLGLIKYSSNPFGDRRFACIEMTPKGKKLQKIFLGSTKQIETNKLPIQSIKYVGVA